MTVAKSPPRRFDGAHGPLHRPHSEPRKSEGGIRSSHWMMLAAGIFASYVGMHTFIARPLANRVEELSAAVVALQTGMRQLADQRDDVTAANDLLTSLTLQTERLRGARVAVEQVRRLQREVQQQAEAAGEALIVLQDVDRLQKEVLAQSQQLGSLYGAVDRMSAVGGRIIELTDTATEQVAGIDRADQSLRQLGALKRRVAIESQGIDTAQTQLSRLVGLKKAVEHVGRDGVDLARTYIAALAELKQRVMAAGEDIDRAKGVGTALISLQDDIANQESNVIIAREHADQLLALKDTLTERSAEDVAIAGQNLDQLIALEQRLAGQDGTIRTAIESLELLADLQTEFRDRVQELDGIRRGLTELVVLESTVARTVRALQPLTQLTDLDRLDPQAVREVARSMLDARTRRIAAHDTADPVGNEPSKSEPTESLVPLPPTGE